MICNNCGSEKSRKVTVGKEGSMIGLIHYIQCTECERVMMEAPEHIPNEQKQRYLKRIQKGQPNDRG